MTKNSLTRPSPPESETDRRETRTLAILSASLIGESNKRRLLQMLFDLGPTSRAELARKMGTKRTTITGIVQPLIEAGVLAEVESEGKRGVGKPAKPLWFSSSAAPVCAVVLMPRRIEAALVTLTGEVFARHEVTVPRDANTQADYIGRIEQCIEAALADAPGPALGIGVAVGGMVDPNENSIAMMNLVPALSGLKLGAHLERRFGISCILGHHPYAILLGERWFGKGRGLDSYAVIYADEVLGSSMYLNGRSFRGPSGFGGEIGHTIVDYEGALCTCGKRGCWETIATLPWLRDRMAARGFPVDPDIDNAGLFELLLAHPAADELLDAYAHNLAVGISNLQTLLMLDNFIIYGGARHGGERLRGRLGAAIDRFAPSLKGLNLSLGKDERTVTLRGAAGLIISDQLQIEI